MKGKKFLIVLGVLVTAGTVGFVCFNCSAETEVTNTLQPIANPPISMPNWGVASQNINNFKKPAKGQYTGLVNQHSIVAGVAVSRDKYILVAIDSSTSDCKKPDVVRIDFTGKGNFSNAPTIPLLKQNVRYGRKYKLKPTLVTFSMKGKKLPVRVSGAYRKYGRDRYMSLELLSGLEGVCRFGNVEQKVYIIDGNSDFKFDERPRVYANYNSTHFQPGDFIVFKEGGWFSKETKRYFIGQPILVNGQWYKLSVKSNDTIAVAQYKFKTAYVKVNSDRWFSALRDNRNRFYSIASTDKPIPIPAGKYRIQRYDRFQKAAGSQNLTKISAVLNGKATHKLDFKDGTTTELNLGDAVICSIEPDVRGRRVTFGFQLKDQLGLSVEISDPDMTLPGLAVYNSKGQRIYQGSMRYG